MPRADIKKYFEVLEKRKIFDHVKNNLIFHFKEMERLMNEIQENDTYDDVFTDDEKSEFSYLRSKGNQIKILLGENTDENIGN